MDRALLGTFVIGMENVQVFLLYKARGGSFVFVPARGQGYLPFIEIGIDYGSWDRVVEVILHEAFEFAAARQHLRYEKSNIIGDHASYLFIFDHTNFTQLCQAIAPFIMEVLPQLATAWRNRHKKKKEKYVRSTTKN